MFLYIIIWLLLTVLVGIWADNWNRSGTLWGLISLIISPLIVGLCLLIAGNSNPKCPKCKETVKSGSRICKHCGQKFKAAVTDQKAEYKKQVEVFLQMYVENENSHKGVIELNELFSKLTLDNGASTLTDINNAIRTMKKTMKDSNEKIEPSDNLGKIATLGELLGKGLITKEEFEEQKQKLLQAI
ncbi:MAG: hypothetical protein GY787_05790 [Alteromonadales bacterium]|nr:hypothetical protein [Alteromonadales bacterium]